MRLIPLMLCLSLLLSSCKKEEEPVQRLRQTRWMLAQVENFPISVSSYSESYRTYVQFDIDNTTNGLGPCNSFTGTYTLGSSAGQLTISQQLATQLACPVQDLETRYLNALARTASYKLAGNKLQLYAAGATEPHLIFTAAD